MTQPQTDPIASATLASLYLAQGHVKRATQMLEAVLRGDPTEGHARALLSRLRLRSSAEIHLEADGPDLWAQWQGAPRHVHVVIMAVRAEADGLRRWFGSSRCAGAFGFAGFRPPFAGGAALACLGSVLPERGFAALRVGEPVLRP